MIIHKTKDNLVSMALAAIDAKVNYWFAHGANCQGVMGAGIAKEIAERLPDVYEADRNCYTKGRSVAGSFSFHEYKGQQGKKATFFNLYTQNQTGADAKYINVYNCFSILQRTYDLLEQVDKPRVLFIPAIGCGIGGLKWEAVEEFINEAAPTLPIVLVEYDGS